MKVRLILKLKKDWAGSKVGDTMTLHNDVFNEGTGIAFFPIERDKWEVIGHDLFTEVKDLNGNEIYANDKISVKDNLTWITKENPKNIGVVKFKEGKFYSDGTNTKYDIGVWQKKIEVVGNVYEV